MAKQFLTTILGQGLSSALASASTSSLAANFNQAIGEIRTSANHQLRNADQIVSAFSGLVDYVTEHDFIEPGGLVTIDEEAANTVIATFDRYLSDLNVSGLTVTLRDGTRTQFQAVADSATGAQLDPGFLRGWLPMNGTSSTSPSDYLIIRNTAGGAWLVNPNIVARNDSTTAQLPLTDFIRQLAENNTLLAAITDICDVASGAKDKLYDGLLSLQNKYATAIDPVKDLFSGAAKAFSAGGFKGLASYILSYYTQPSQLGVDLDGNIQLTDNTTLIPAEYIVGMVNGIFQYGSAIVTAIGAIINPVIGLVAGALAGIINGIVQSFTFDYDSTNAAINSSDSVAAESFPYGLLQVPFDEDVHWPYDNDVWQLLSSYSGVWQVAVPGGYLHVQVKNTGTADSPDYRLAYEFHASTRNVSNFSWGSIASVSTTEITYQEASAVMHTVSSRMTQEQLVSWWASRATPFEGAIKDTGYLTDESDATLRGNLLRNTAIFYLWCVAGMSEISVARYHYFTAVSPYTGEYLDFSLTSRLLGLSVTPSEPFFAPALAFCDDVINTADRAAQWEAFGNTAPTVLSSQFNSTSSLCPGVSAGLRGQHFAACIYLPDSYEYQVKTPKYNKTTFWLYVGLAAASAAIVVAATIAIRKIGKKVTAKKAARVNSAYDAFVKDPSNANYKAYVKAVKSNNRWATIFGGTKYSKTDYWFGSSSSSGTAIGSLSTSQLLSTNAQIVALITGSDS